MTSFSVRSLVSARLVFVFLLLLTSCRSSRVVSSGRVERTSGVYSFSDSVWLAPVFQLHLVPCSGDSVRPEISSFSGPKLAFVRHAQVSVADTSSMDFDSSMVRGRASEIQKISSRSRQNFCAADCLPWCLGLLAVLIYIGVLRRHYARKP